MSGQHDQNRRSDATTTQDLGARYAATAPVSTRSRPWYETAGAEEHVRTRGRFLIISGLAVGALTLVLATVYARGFNDDMPLAYLLPLYAIAFGAVAIGGMEYLNRPSRYANDQALQRVQRLESQISALIGLLSEELKQQYYRGIAEGARMMPPMTGTENPAGRSGRYRTGEVVNFRRPR